MPWNRGNPILNAFCWHQIRGVGGCRGRGEIAGEVVEGEVEVAEATTCSEGGRGEGGIDVVVGEGR